MNAEILVVVLEGLRARLAKADSEGKADLAGLYRSGVISIEYCLQQAHEVGAVKINTAGAYLTEASERGRPALARRCAELLAWHRTSRLDESAALWKMARGLDGEEADALERAERETVQEALRFAAGAALVTG